MVTTRSTKGSPLTYAEMDNNWDDLSTRNGICINDYGTTGTALQLAINAATDYEIVCIPAGMSLSMTGLVTIDKPLTLVMTGAILTWASDTADQGIRVTSSNVKIIGGELIGPKATYDGNSATQVAIEVQGTDATDYLTNITIKPEKIHNWYYGVYLRYVDNFSVSDSEIYDVYQAGIEGLSVQNGVVNKNYIHDIVSPTASHAYGVSISRWDDDSLTTEPPSRDVVISNNVVDNVSNWEGLDTHGGIRITFTGNTVTNCFIGINVAPIRDASHVSQWSAQDIIISNNTIDSGVTDGSMGSGIILGGAADITPRVTGVVSGNTVRGYGNDTVAGQQAYGGMLLQSSDGVIISENSFADCACIGLLIVKDSYGFTIIGNTFTDIWADATVNAYGIFTKVDGPVTGYIGDNSFIKTGLRSAKAVDYLGAIYVRNVSGSSIRLGPNYTEIGSAVYLNDTGDHCLRGVSGSDTSTSGTGEDDLKSVTIPAGRLGQGQRLHITAAGTITGTAGNKTIKFYFGSSNWTVIPAATDATDWTVEVDVVVTGDDTQRVVMTGRRGNVTVFNDHSNGAIDMTTAATLKLTGECANAGDTITQTTMIVRED